MVLRAPGASNLHLCPQGLVFGIVCEVRTQDPENFDEEVKSLLTACHPIGEGI